MSCSNMYLGDSNPCQPEVKFEGTMTWSIKLSNYTNEALESLENYAVSVENYEDACHFRDELKRRTK